MVETPNILESLGTLTPAQQREAHARLSFLLNPTGKANTDDVEPRKHDDEDEQMVLSELHGILAAAGDTRKIPLSVLLKINTTGQAFKRGVKVLCIFVRQNFKPAKKVDKLKAIRILLRCIAKDLNQRSVPICPKTVSQAMERIANVVDRQFPSYMESGLLPAVLKMPCKV